MTLRLRGLIRTHDVTDKLFTEVWREHGCPMVLSSRGWSPLRSLSTCANISRVDNGQGIGSHRSQLSHGRENSYAANEGKKIAIYQSSRASTTAAQSGSLYILKWSMCRVAYLVKPRVKTLERSQRPVVSPRTKGQTHMSTASHVISIVQVKPNMDMKEKRRWASSDS